MSELNKRTACSRCLKMPWCNEHGAGLKLCRGCHWEAIGQFRRRTQMSAKFNTRCLDVVQKRDVVLRSMCFDSYASYLRSDIWKEIREAVMRKAKWMCRACGRKAVHVHHRSYDKDTMSGRGMKNLIALCQDCHQAIEFSPSGTKRTLHEANEAFAKMCRTQVLPKIVRPKDIRNAMRNLRKTQKRLSKLGHIAPKEPSAIPINPS